MSITATFQTLFTSARQILRPKTTEEFPWNATRPRAERFRTSFALVHDEHGDEACIGCKMCEKICPSQIISVTPGPKRESPNTGKKRGWHEEFTIDTNACIVCELCVQVCPTDSIVMLRVLQLPSFDRNALVLDRDKLYANEQLHQNAWATGSRLSAMQAPPKPAPRKPRPPASPPPTGPGTAPTKTQENP